MKRSLMVAVVPHGPYPVNQIITKLIIEKLRFNRLFEAMLNGVMNIKLWPIYLAALVALDTLTR